MTDSQKKPFKASSINNNEKVVVTKGSTRSVGICKAGTRNHKMEDKELTYEEVVPILCSHCGLDESIHDGDGFCPGGTEEFGGRR